MAEAAIADEDPTITLQQKLKRIEGDILYAEEWNQDSIQIGSAYFAKANLLANADLVDWTTLVSDSHSNLEYDCQYRHAEACFRKALFSFMSAGMDAETARTLFELAVVLHKQDRDMGNGPEHPGIREKQEDRQAYKNVGHRVLNARLDGSSSAQGLVALVTNMLHELDSIRMAGNQRENMEKNRETAMVSYQLACRIAKRTQGSRTWKTIFPRLI